MSFSFYELDQSKLSLLNLDNFLNGLSVNDFIEELSKDHLLKQADVNQYGSLDPKPYIRTFESTLRALKELTLESNKQQILCEEQVESYELKHSENVLQLSSKIDRTIKKFDTLDVKISDVTIKINPLGSSLNKITNSRDRSMETIFLIRAYHGFYVKQKYDPLEALRTSQRFEDKVKCAKTVSNLLTLSKKIQTEDAKTEKCLILIQQYSELMERELLERFEDASEANEFDIMKEIAGILFEFNGGATVVQAFVSKNDLLIDAEKSNEDEESILDNEAVWTKLSDPNFVGIIQDTPTESLLERLKVSIKAQARIVKLVFVDPVPVLKIFIQRVYAQMIQNKVSTLLLYSLSVSSLAHVRILYSLYSSVGDFTKDVKEFVTANEFDKENELSIILDQSYFELFIDYTSDSVYFNREKKNLEEIIYDIVHKFNSYNDRAILNNYLNVKIDNLDNSDYRESNTQNERYSVHFSERKRLNQFKLFVKAKMDKSVARGSTDIEDGEFTKLNILTVETILKSTIESIARLLELAPNKSPEYSLEILEILLFDFGKLYIGGGLEVAYDQLKQETAKISLITPFNFSYLKSFTMVSEILFLMSSTIKKIILPCAINSPNIKNRMSNLTNNYIMRCETSLNIILSETLEMVSARTFSYLSKQKKKDFASSADLDNDTETSDLICEFLTTVNDDFRACLNNANLKNAQVKVGMNFLNQLLEHYKKFTISSTGGIVLTKEVIRYKEIIDEWAIAELSENFQLLKEISNLFTVQMELIGSLVSEGQLANLKPYNIKQYVSKRDDYNSGIIERFFNFKG